MYLWEEGDLRVLLLYHLEGLHMPGTVLDAEDTGVNETDDVLCPPEVYIQLYLYQAGHIISLSQFSHLWREKRQALRPTYCALGESTPPPRPREGLALEPNPF